MEINYFYISTIKKLDNLLYSKKCNDIRKLVLINNLIKEITFVYEKKSQKKKIGLILL